jgi:glycosyltransferase involved in cell wall biosynthesis
MRIALYHNLTSGGSKREAYEFARHLVRNGHAVDLFRPSTANEEFLPLAGIVQRQFTFNLNLIPDLPVRLPGLTRYLDLAGLGVNLRRLRRVSRLIAGEVDAGGYDFVFAHHDRIVQSPYLFRYLRSRSVYYCAEPMRAFYDPPVRRMYQLPETTIDRIQANWYAPARALRRRIIKAEDRRNVRAASVLLTNSFFSAESIYRAYDLRPRVVYLGVDVDAFQPMSLPKGNYVLSVGAVNPLKGYDFIITALGLISPSCRPELVIVGNSVSRREKNFLESLATECDVRINILANVGEQQLVELYNRARAFVYAPHLEPFGLAPIEAMSCGVPVVAVKEGGVRESVVDGVTGFLVERSPALFAGAVQRLMRDERLCKDLGRSGRAQVLDSWTWEHASKRLEQAVLGSNRTNSKVSDPLPV